AGGGHVVEWRSSRSPVSVYVPVSGPGEAATIEATSFAGSVQPLTTTVPAAGVIVNVAPLVDQVAGQTLVDAQPPPADVSTLVSVPVWSARSIHVTAIVAPGGPTFFQVPTSGSAPPHAASAGSAIAIHRVKRLRMVSLP